MWMLLEQGARKAVASKTAVADSRKEAVVRERTSKAPIGSTKTSLLEYLGAAASAAQPNGASAPVSIFLHPGRTPVGRVGVERIFDQFECAPVRVHPTLEEAEANHEGDVGFLLEVARPFTDPMGTRHPRGVIFARSVRN
jgi:hypothetical protein